MKKLNNKLFCDNSSRSLISSAITLRAFSFSVLGTLLSTAFINISVNSTEIDDDRKRELPLSSALPPLNEQLQRASLIGKNNEEDFLFKKRRKRIENQFSLLNEKTKISKKNPTYQESDFNWWKISKAILLVFLGVAIFLGQTGNFNQSILPQVSAYEEASILADGKIGIIPHMRKSNIDKRVSIAVIGGGHTGTILSALLANMKDKQGNLAFDIHLFEKDLNFMNGASIAPARLHLGGEYPKDPITARQCLRSAIIFRQMFQTETVLTSRKRIDFLLAKVSTKKPTNDPESLTLEQLQTHYRDLQSLYKDIFHYFSQKWGNETTARLLFGMPDDEFFTLLNSPNDIDDERLRSHFTGGVITSERGLQPIALGVIIERLLSRDNVYLHLGEAIVGAKYQEDRGYILDSYFKNGGINQEFVVHYVVNAAWHDIPYLNHQASQHSQFYSSVPDPPTKVYIRSLGLFDVSKCEKLADNRSYFGLMGADGGMVSFFSSNVAALYSPVKDLSYQGRYDLHHQEKEKTFLSSDAQNTLSILKYHPTKSKRVLSAISKDAASKYPFLERAQYIRLLTRTTVSWDNETYQRQHIKPTWPFGNNTPWIQAYATKATFSPLIALQVIGQLAKQSNIREKINLSESTQAFLYNLTNADFGQEQLAPENIRLPEEFGLITESLNAKDPVFLAEMQMYAFRRQLPFAMIEALNTAEVTTLPQDQIKLLDLVNLRERAIDLRSIDPTEEFLNALAQKISHLPFDFEFDSFRFRYSPSNGPEIFRFLAGKPINELEIDQLSLKTTLEIQNLIKIIKECDLKRLVLRRLSSDSSAELTHYFLLKLDRAAQSLTNVQLHFATTPTWEVTQILLKAFQGVKNLRHFIFSNNQLGFTFSQGPDYAIHDNFSPLIDFIEGSKVQTFDLSYNQLFSENQKFMQYSVLNAVCGNPGLVVTIHHNNLTPEEEKNWTVTALLEQEFKCAEERKKAEQAKIIEQCDLRRETETVLLLKSEAMRSVTTQLDDEKIKAEKLTNDLEMLQQDDTLTQVLRVLGYTEDAPTVPPLMDRIDFFRVFEYFGLVECKLKKTKETTKELDKTLDHIEELEVEKRLVKQRVMDEYPTNSRKTLYFSESLAHYIKPHHLHFPTIFIVHDGVRRSEIQDLFYNLRSFNFHIFNKYDITTENINLIDRTDKVILIGSPDLIKQYDQRSITLDNSHSIVKEIDAIRIRDLKRKNSIIALYFLEDCASQTECFPQSFQHLKALSFDTHDYFYSFMSLIKEIYEYHNVTGLMERYFDQIHSKYPYFSDGRFHRYAG